MKKAFNIKGIECLTQALDCGIIIDEDEKSVLII
jgi:hypothetical protein